MSPAVKMFLTLFALVNLWLGAAILLAGIRAAVEGTPDHIGTIWLLGLL